MGRALFYFSIILGSVGRIFLASLGHNYDLESWIEVAGLLHEGKSPYVHSYRWPYLPLGWIPVMGASLLDATLGLAHPESFHMIFAGILTIFDGITAAILQSVVGTPLAIVYFLNPILLLLTGFHSQLEGIAICLALIATRLIASPRGIGCSVATAFSVLLLAASVGVKHVFIFFPIWVLFWRPAGSLRGRMLYVLSVYLLVLASAIPFLVDSVVWSNFSLKVLHYDPGDRTGDGPNGAIATVLAFVLHGGNLAPLTDFIGVFTFRSIMSLAVLVSGFYVARLIETSRSAYALFFSYLLIIFSLAPNLWVQYLTLVVGAFVFFGGAGWIASLTLVGTLFLFFSPYNIATIPAFGDLSRAVIEYDYHWPIGLLFQLLLLIRTYFLFKACYRSLRPMRVNS